jgi:hypothetical protein
VHCVSSVHVVPSAPVVWHVPALHAYPVAQSVAVVVHVVLHDDPLHKNPPQLAVAGATHAPNPSQYDVPVNVDPVHDAGAHAVDVPGNAPHFVRVLPSHVALHVPVPPHAVRVPCGSPATGEHVPSLPETLHASH